MIVTVGNTKGGVGKTTLSLNLAIARALAGRDVWLIDGDRQGTAQTAITVRSEAGRSPQIACAQYSDGSTLRAQVQQVGPKFEDIVIDAGGRDSTALRAALVLSDVLVVLVVEVVVVDVVVANGLVVVVGGSVLGGGGSVLEVVVLVVVETVVVVSGSDD